MLTRLLGAAGRDLELVPLDEPAGPRLAEVIKSTPDPSSTNRIDWTLLRSFTDWIRRHPDQLAASIRRPPSRTGNALLDNVAAAIAEKLSDDARAPRPAWCSHVRPLVERYITPGTPRMQQRTIASAPRQFTDRNVYVSGSSLWHQP